MQMVARLAVPSESENATLRALLGRAMGYVHGHADSCGNHTYCRKSGGLCDPASLRAEFDKLG